MTERRDVAQLVAVTGAVLDEHGIPDPVAEARELVAALFDVPRHWPLLHAHDPVDDATWRGACEGARRRTRGAPLAYAVGTAAFRQLTLAVDDRVLIPRPETEQLVDIVLEEQRQHPGGLAIDVGTGSGAIAVALACEGYFDEIVATDISADALAVARNNVARFQHAARTPIRLVHGAGLGAVGHVVPDVVVSNPPYIAYGEAAQLPRSVRDWEPAIALYGGHDGMRVTAQLVRSAAAVLRAGGLLALEVDARRASLAAELVAADPRYHEVKVRLDLFGRERFVTGRRGD